MIYFVDETKPYLVEYLLDVDGKGKPTTSINLEFLKWKQKNQALRTLINSSLTSGVPSTIARPTTSLDVWVSLEKHYTSQSWSRCFKPQWEEISLIFFFFIIIMLIKWIILMTKSLWSFYYFYCFGLWWFLSWLYYLLNY